MKKLITALLFIIISSIASAKEPVTSVETKCINGHLYAIVVVITDNGVAVDMEQDFEPNPFLTFTPQPVKCK